MVIPLVMTTSPQQPVCQYTKRFQVKSLYLEPLASDHLRALIRFNSFVFFCFQPPVGDHLANNRAEIG